MPRVVYGNAFSESGWPMVQRNECDNNPFPGTNVAVPLQHGIPNRIMKAFGADHHAYIEPLQQHHCGGWTPTNDVKSSNHLGGTATDLNWQFHPFRTRTPTTRPSRKPSTNCSNGMRE